MAPPRTSLLARAPIVDTLSRGLQTAWDKGWAPPILLEPDVLWDRATNGHEAKDEFSGRSAEDAADFRERLDKLCRSLNEEARLNPMGRAFAHGQLVRSIKQRFALGKLWRDRPALLKTKIAPPIIIVGQMRAGTTRMHRLLAADPGHSATRFSDSWHPVPRTPDLRPVWSGAALIFARALNPWLETIHPFGAARADEELGWLAGAFDHCAYEAQWHIPSYVAFSEARDATPVYREFIRILRTDAASHGNAGKPRVMKVPQFSEDLTELLAQFPEARIVVAERDAESTIRSSVSLVANQMGMQSDHIDLERIETEWARKTRLRRYRATKALADFGGRIAHVDFAALDANWEAAIKTVYAALDIPLTETALEAMRSEQDRADKSAHKKHRAQLDNGT
ncbi:sulfotransferase [Pontixanthobacter aestiaquae]|uniref:Sulfotransferase n=1 Tax=Pontixanthobacter aestiaquae TaxID=1509367 RepID=A0A844Z9D3_9SPHN|nr:sulfotransferase [Pontixanthobacter aestiaquae]MDN3644885.1 sulfotransferase [Pontixanthobacter aestiaquae]MXO84114.1 sulfotransferase [Pontixanthobacter aestiaquae]